MKKFFRSLEGLFISLLAMALVLFIQSNQESGEQDETEPQEGQFHKETRSDLAEIRSR
jgi:hypothetical protein